MIARKRFKSIIVCLLIGAGFIGQALASELELESKVPATLEGTLGYADMKYWVEVPDKGNVELMPKEQDEEALMKLIDKHVSFQGAILTYSNGSRYFEPKLASQPKSSNFIVKKADNAPFEIYFGDRLVRRTDEYQFLSIAHQMDIPEGKVALLELGSGGVACPTLYQLIVVKINTPAMLSEEFGTCSDEGKLSPSANGFTLTLPGNPAETWKWDPTAMTVIQQ